MKWLSDAASFFSHSRFVPVRLSAYYAAHFAVTGIQLPFWAAWLSSRGLDADQIGVLLALGPWVSIALSPMAGRIADGSGRGRLVMGVFGALATMGFIGFSQSRQFALMAILSVVAFGSHSALLPLAESVTQERVLAGDAFYGRVRLWGSISFMVLSAASGGLVAAYGIGTVPWALAASSFCCVVTSQLLPARRVSRAARSAAPVENTIPLRIHWTPLVLGIALANAIQATHSIYYGFGSLVWRARHIPDSTIGLLWAEGVVAEALLFAFSPRIVASFGPAWLLASGALGATLRWAILSWAQDVEWIVPAQLLHAVSFGATHLGGMELLRRGVPTTRLASAQGIYSAIAGCAHGLGTWIAGSVYARWGPDSYAGASLVALGLTLFAVIAAPRIVLASQRSESETLSASQ